MSLAAASGSCKYSLTDILEDFEVWLGLVEIVHRSFLKDRDLTDQMTYQET